MYRINQQAIEVFCLRKTLLWERNFCAIEFKLKGLVLVAALYHIKTI